ncbi:MAG: calcium/sodium antiporter [Gemmatimonadales bacterium]|nr:MAG: calcium/sodium antiporter [Gemmatimonadales bacterium]
MPSALHVDLSFALAAVGAGLVLLAAGGESLVRGATRLARLAGLSTTVIGLTVVALGTSLPELMVSLIAAARGTPDIAVANVIGSNIANIGLILGLTALLVSLPVHGSAVRLEWPFMFAASWIAMLLARDGMFDRLEGGFFVVSLALFTVFMVYESRVSVGTEESGEIADSVGRRTLKESDRPWVRATSACVLGAGLLFLGGRFLVDGAVELARYAGITERVIGLTLVAVGTSIPELATSLVAAYRGHTEVAVANVIGSNIYNILGILGVTALIHPIPVQTASVQGDLWWMLGVSFLLLPILWLRSNLSRIEGGVLLAVYAVYIFTIL